MSQADYDSLDGAVDQTVLEPDEVVSEVGGSTLIVCQELLPDGTICGATFDNKISWNGHRTGKHRDRSGDRPRGPNKNKSGPRKQSPPRASRARSEEEASTARATHAPVANRAATYAQSIALLGTLCYFAIPKMDQVDLGYLNAGTPNLAGALDQVGETNPQLRSALDMILGGGGGGAWVALILAIAGIGAPIASHHGWLPPSVGAAMAASTGGPPPPAPSVPTAPPGETPAPQGGWDPTTEAGVLAFMSGIPPTVMADLTGKMMSMDQATVVTVPTFPTEGPPADAPGSEQLKPTVPSLLDGLPVTGNGTEAEPVREPA